MRCPSGIQPPNRARTRGWPALCLSSLDCPAAYIWLIRSYLADSLGKGDRVMVNRPAAPAQLGDPRGGEAVGDRAEGRRRRRLAQGGSRPGRTQRPAGERRPHLGSRPAIGSQRLRLTVTADSGGTATIRARRPLPVGVQRLQDPASARRSVAGTAAVGVRPAPCRFRARVGRRCA